MLLLKLKHQWCLQQFQSMVQLSEVLKNWWHGEREEPDQVLHEGECSRTLLLYLLLGGSWMAVRCTRISSPQTAVTDLLADYHLL